MVPHLVEVRLARSNVDTDGRLRHRDEAIRIARGPAKLSFLGCPPFLSNNGDYIVFMTPII